MIKISYLIPTIRRTLYTVICAILIALALIFWQLVKTGDRFKVKTGDRFTEYPFQGIKYNLYDLGVVEANMVD